MTPDEKPARESNTCALSTAALDASEFAFDHCAALIDSAVNGPASAAAGVSNCPTNMR
jgi:hypothetical protein